MAFLKLSFVIVLVGLTVYEHSIGYIVPKHAGSVSQTGTKIV